ncbi:MAG: hypothetical protein MPK10_05480 [Gammaproteobacteria bacterium]|nr:hypothetical protein [Gammaproteobacteria bacterium]
MPGAPLGRENGGRKAAGDMARLRGVDAAAKYTAFAAARRFPRGFSAAEVFRGDFRRRFFTAIFTAIFAAVFAGGLLFGGERVTSKFHFSPPPGLLL